MKKQTIKKVADSFRTYDQMYDDLIKKGPGTLSYCLDNDGVWKRINMSWMLESFTTHEEFEKCARLKKFMEEHYVAPSKKQEELNTKLDEYFNL